MSKDLSLLDKNINPINELVMEMLFCKNCQKNLQKNLEKVFRLET